MTHRFLVPLALLVMVALSLAPAARGQDYSNIRIVRLSFVEGGVQYQRPGEAWQDANMNLPIQQGFALRTSDGYAEVEFENSLTMRLGPDSAVEFSLLALVNGGHVTRLTVSQGTAIVSAKVSRADALSVTASGLNVKVPRSGRFRVDASPAHSWVTVFAGKVEVDSGSGDTSVVLGSRHTLHEPADGNGAPEIASNPPADDFDKWVSQRETAVSYAQNGTSDVLESRNYTEGFADLYDFGLWSDIPGYGFAWSPYGLGANWMPFTSGQWMFMGGTGWNWVSSEPWGWLPYHFGSWVNAPGVGWAWIPTGAGTFQPATATWVRVNNQLGWVPNTVTPQSSKSFKPVAPTVILAAPGAGGVIAAGDRLPLVAGTTAMRVASAPGPAFAAATGSGPVRSAAAIPRTSASTSVAQPRFSGPTSFRATHGGVMQASGLSSVPPSLRAPHSVPVPHVMAGTSGGFKGGFAGSPHGYSGGRMAGSTSASRAAAPSSASAGSHGGGHR
jgi:hypothetical protein